MWSEVRVNPGKGEERRGRFMEFLGVLWRYVRYESRRWGLSICLGSWYIGLCVRSQCIPVHFGWVILFGNLLGMSVLWEFNIDVVISPVTCEFDCRRSFSRKWGHLLKRPRPTWGSGRHDAIVSVLSSLIIYPSNIAVRTVLWFLKLAPVRSDPSAATWVTS